jgi:hypothetical protein
MRILLAAILASLAASPALADPKPPADVGQMVTDDCAKATQAKKQCVLKFDAHDVTGGTPKHDGIQIDVLTPTKTNLLIRIRRDFIQEILKTAEDL